LNESSFEIRAASLGEQ